jgi:hypothetical protein
MAGVNPSAPPPQIEVDPGYKTTEFWQSLLTQIVAAVVAIISLFRQPSGAQGEQWSAAFNQLVPVVAGLLAAFGANRQYLVSRTDVKTAAANANAAIAQASMGQATTLPLPGLR